MRTVPGVLAVQEAPDARVGRAVALVRDALGVPAAVLGVLEQAGVPAVGAPVVLAE